MFRSSHRISADLEQAHRRGLAGARMAYKEQTLAVHDRPCRVQVTALPIGQPAGHKDLVSREEAQRGAPAASPRVHVLIIHLDLRVVKCHARHTLHGIIGSTAADERIGPAVLPAVDRPRRPAIDLTPQVVQGQPVRGEVVADDDPISARRIHPERLKPRLEGGVSDRQVRPSWMVMPAMR